MNQFIFLLIFGLFFSQDLSLPGFPKYDDIVVEIRNKFGKELKKKYDYQIFGTGGGIPDGIYCTSWHLVSKNKVDLKQARREYLWIIEELLKRINNDKRMKAHLKDKSLTYQNIDLILDYDDPRSPLSINEVAGVVNIALVCKRDNIIRYGIKDDKDSCGYIDFHTETYEEALKILNE